MNKQEDAREKRAEQKAAAAEERAEEAKADAAEAKAEERAQDRAEARAEARAAAAHPPVPAVAAAKAAAAAPLPVAKVKASTPGYTMCRVTGTAIRYQKKLIPEGTVAEFDDATVLDMPGVLVSVE
jgi:hypothetical protein